jgi:hypothetical protein
MKNERSAPKGGSAKTGETRNSMYSSETKAKGFGAKEMKGKQPTEAQEGEAVDTPPEKERNEQREDKA